MLAGRLSCQHVAQRSNRAFEQQRPCLHFHCVCATDPNHSDSRAKLWVPVVNKVYRPQEFATTRTPIGKVLVGLLDIEYRQFLSSCRQGTPLLRLYMLL